MRLILESTPKTPDVHFDRDSGIFEIKGMSCAEYALDFYRPVFEWMDGYMANPKSKTTLNVKLKYFNTSSAKCILQLLERIGKIQEKGFSIEINWFYNKDDEQMITDGENYSVILGLPINLVEIEKK